jgi:transcriptional regulator of arginine metabolism
MIFRSSARPAAAAVGYKEALTMKSRNAYYAAIMHKHTKEYRQRLLREIVGRQGIGGQHHLQEELARRGIDVTQATISRDLREMGFVKTRLINGAYRYELFEKLSEDSLWSRLRIMFKNFVTDVMGTGNLVLVKTSPGNANGVASLIDGLKSKEILGTVAGDDTILIVVDEKGHMKNVMTSFRRLLT